MTYPQVKVAVEWWCDRLTNPVPHELGDARLNTAMMIISDTVDPPSAEQVEIFGQALTRAVNESIRLQEKDGIFNGAVRLSVDYHPDDQLQDAADASGIQNPRFPLKTMMKIDRDQVTVKAGYGNPQKTIWAADSA